MRMKMWWGWMLESDVGGGVLGEGEGGFEDGGGEETSGGVFGEEG